MWISNPYKQNKCTFYFICILRSLLLRANPGNNLGLKIEAQFEKYPSVPIQFIGIPSDGKGKMLDWKSEDLWN